MFLYYSSFKNKNKVTHWTFEQLAYMAKCSYALVEKTIKKLKTAGILEHTVNEHNKFKHLKKATLKQMGCNPFK
jgi:biotin operon repressor